ncbi:hypothetical protein DUI70_3785 [Streptomyces albus]|nr:hypothetical protein DUI70_3785 [Streptomyces albus]
MRSEWDVSGRTELRPRAQQAPALDAVRRIRLAAEDEALVFTDRKGRERRWKTGKSGIVRVRYFPPDGKEKAHGLWRLSRFGTAVFEDTSGTPVLCLPLAEWIPESDNLSAAYWEKCDAPGRSGLRGLASELGIEFADADTGLSEVSADYRHHRARFLTLSTRPRALNWTRGVTIFAWFGFLVYGIEVEAHRAFAYPIAACMLLVYVAAGYLVHFVQHRRVRDRVPPGEGPLLSPAPVPDAAATPRFLDVSFLKVLPAELVLVDSTGQERRLPRRGAAALRSVALVSGSDGAPLGVELRGPGEQVRALIPWRSWFGGPGGKASWDALTAALGLPVKKRTVRQSAEDVELHHPLRIDLQRLAPLSPAEARKRTQESALGAASGEVLVLAVLSFSLLGALTYGVSEEGYFLAGVLSALNLFLILIPYATHQLRSRLRLDRPAAAQEPESTA